MSKRSRWDSSSEDEEKAPTKPSKRVDIEKDDALVSQQPKASLPVVSDNTQEATTAAAAQAACHNPSIHGCRSVYDTYERLDRISEGTFGVVWKARDIVTNELFALKQIKLDVENDRGRNNNNGFPVAALREINCLLALSSSFSSSSIVSVREMVVADKQVFMAMELMDGDLETALRQQPQQLSNIKSIVQQLLTAVAGIHQAGFLHRDLKPANLLVHHTSGRVAVADFGLARKQLDDDGDNKHKLTLTVVTLWYRAPEILFGHEQYGPAIDLWSVGCILAELVEGQNQAILQGQGELDQISRIFALLGPPTADNWPGFEQLPNAGLFRWNTSSKVPQLRERFPLARMGSGKTFLDTDGFDLLKGLLTLDPRQRLTAEQALAHNFFHKGVAPKRPVFKEGT